MWSLQILNLKANLKVVTGSKILNRNPLVECRAENIVYSYEANVVQQDYSKKMKAWTPYEQQYKKK